MYLKEEVKLNVLWEAGLAEVNSTRKGVSAREICGEPSPMRETGGSASATGAAPRGGNGMSGLPLIQSLLSPTQVLPADVMNRLALQAFISRNPYGAELFTQSWQPAAAGYSETPHIVSSSDQIVVKRQRSPVGTRRRKRKEESSLPVVKSTTSIAPLSPPVSASSPLSSGSISDITVTTNNGSPTAANGTSETSQNGKSDGRGKLHTCDICHRSFGYKHVLQNHERTHTGEKPFECPECNKRFTRDHHLKTHMRLHTGEKPYQCQHCDRNFVQVANLRRHTRVHTGERPYACEICSNKFSDSNQLKAHMLIHNGEKPFKCDLCNGKFRRRHHLIHHKCAAKDSSGGPLIENGGGGKYLQQEEIIMRSHEEDLPDEDDDSKCAMSDDTVSSDSITAVPSTQSFNAVLRNNLYHQPWISPPPPIIPIPTRHLSPMPEALNLSSGRSFPMQTEPEDLSVKKKYRSANNNNSGSSVTGDSSRSTSPMEDSFSPPLS